MPRHRVLQAAILLTLSACATIERAPYTAADSQIAVVAGAPEVRFWADAPDAARRMRPEVAGRITTLALSGGADEGAYGAGLLAGWSESGRRPVFSVVTGVSTGALVAPFAFLGSGDDAIVSRLYTSIGPKDVYKARFAGAIPFSTSVASTKPLARLIAQEVTPALVERIAAAHRAGRRLFVGTVNLDAQRMVIWDLGAIAFCGLPTKVALFRQVVLASASVPGIFAPVVIDAVADGRPVRELHVDGATSAQFLAVPRQAIIDDVAGGVGGAGAPQSLYLIVNSRLGGDFRLVKPRTFPILRRAFALNQQSALLSLANTSYLYARDHAIDWNLSFIGNEVDASDTLFDTAYMRRLYAYGLARGRAGGEWRKQPPDGTAQAAAGAVVDVTSPQPRPVDD